ncbi:MAG: TM2 domain-containing protein [Oscillospiraceae bacterium]|nr:TM2 domain-containing protein [Oscillospiraceae bacterium]
MYCRNCGSPMYDNAVVCVKCGCQRGMGANFCPNCGRRVTPGAAVCVSCGVALYAGNPGYGAPYGAPAMPGAKSKTAAGILGIFLGAFGAHNFYLGYTTKAVIQLVVTVATLGIGGVAMGIWGLIEGIMILTGSIAVDGRGMPLGQ